MREMTPHPDMDDKPGVVFPPPALYLASAAAGWLTKRLLGGPPHSTVPPGYWGIIPIVLGAGLAAWAAITMHQHQTHIDPSKPAIHLVTSGPFSWTRNPLYAAMTLVIIGVAMMDRNVWILVFLIPTLMVIHYGVVLREERYLAGKFGVEYHEYRDRVRRWL